MKLTKNKQQNGFSLMEVLVVMVVFLIIISAVFALMRGTIITANANYQMTEANQSLRNSQEFLTRDLLVAGDGVKDIGNIWLPISFVTKYLTVRPIHSLDPQNTGYVSIGLIISDNNLPAGVKVPDSDSPTLIKEIKERTDRISMLTIDPFFIQIEIPAGSADYLTGEVKIPYNIEQFKVGEIYYLTGNGTATFGTITAIDAGNKTIYFAQGDIYGLNQNSDTGSFASVTMKNSQSMTIKRIKIVQYFVDSSDRLIRRLFGGKDKGIIDSVIAEHLVTLQLEYILKPENLADSNVFAPAVPQIELSQQSLIRLVEPQIITETASVLQDGDKHQIEGKVRISLRNIQYLDALTPKDSEGNTNLSNPAPAPIAENVSPTPPPTPLPIESPTPTVMPTAFPTATPTP